MIDSLISVLENFRSQMPKVDATGQRLAKCLLEGHKILACGNGGSASDSMHLCEELTGRYRENRKALAAISLNADGTALTCIANDFGFEEVFARQVEALGEPGDVLVAFSTSGSSPNVIRAVEAAKEKGIDQILLSGKGGGAAAGMVSQAILVPSDDSARIQEVHTFILHSWLEEIEAAVFAR